MNHSRRLKNRTANHTSYQDRPRPDATQNPGLTPSHPSNDLVAPLEWRRCLEPNRAAGPLKA